MLAIIASLIVNEWFVNSSIKSGVEVYNQQIESTYEMMDDIEAFVVSKGINKNDTKEITDYLESYPDYMFQVYAGNQEDFIRSYYDGLSEYNPDMENVLELEVNTDSFYAYNVRDIEPESRFISDEQSFTIIIATYKPVGKTVSRADGINILAFILVFVLVFSWLINRKRKQLFVINNGLERISGGDLDHRIEVRGKDEIASVAHHINDMSYALKERIEKEQALEQTKNQLIANVSHDLRTPLTTITGYLALLKDQSDLDHEALKQYIEVSYKKAKDLNMLVDQLFDYVLLTNHQMNLNKQPVDMNMFLSQVIDESSINLSNEGFTIDFKGYKRPLKANIDSKQWIRVFDNLLSNIRKYGDTNVPVDVSVKIKRSGFIEISFVNGIKETLAIDESNVFERYFTTKRINDGKDKSAGLGLAICKQIVEQHEGEINFAIRERKCYITIGLAIEEVM